MNDLANKVVIVTGGSGGIGLPTCAYLAGLGMKVVVLDIDKDGLRRAQAALSPTGNFAGSYVVDVTSLSQMQECVATVETEHRGLDAMVSVAGGRGGVTPATIDSMSAEEWTSVVGLNLQGPFNAIKASAPALRRRGGGAIVVVGSLAGIRMSMNLGAAYTAAKSGVMGLVRHAAFELARDRIRVNAVLPGATLTPAMKTRPAELLASVTETIPMGRMIEPEEIAAPIGFFLSCASSGCTGTHVVVDGGMHIGAPVSSETYFRHRRSTVVSQ